MDSKIFNSLQIDAIGEILNISLGASATAVSTMLSKRTDITTPNVSVVSYEEFQFAEIEPAIGVEITYVTGLSGSNIMLLKRSDVKTICEILMGMEIPDEEFELNEMNLSAVCEVMNQMMGAASTALSDLLGRMVNISTPESFEMDDLDKVRREHFPVQQGPALGLGDHRGLRLPVLLPLQQQICGVIVKIAQAEHRLRPVLLRLLLHLAGEHIAPVAGKKQHVDVLPGLLRRGGGQAGAQSAVVRRCNLIAYLVRIAAARHGASSFDGINITKEKELVMTEI